MRFESTMVDLAGQYTELLKQRYLYHDRVGYELHPDVAVEQETKAKASNLLRLGHGLLPKWLKCRRFPETIYPSAKSLTFSDRAVVVESLHRF